MRFLLFCVLIGAVIAPAQVRRSAGGKVDETTRIINDCENRTDRFKKTLDKALGRDNVRLGQGREDQLNREASQLEQAMNKVGDSWNRDHNMQKTRGFVSAAITVSQDLNRAMHNVNMGGDAESEWAAVRTELNRLAQNFGLPQIRW